MGREFDDELAEFVTKWSPALLRIGIGSSLDAVQAYPDFDENGMIGRAHVSVRGNPQAVYRIAWDDDRKVIQLTLQYVDQGCYE